MTEVMEFKIGEHSYELTAEDIQAIYDENKARAESGDVNMAVMIRGTDNAMAIIKEHTEANKFLEESLEVIAEVGDKQIEFILGTIEAVAKDDDLSDLQKLREIVSFTRKLRKDKEEAEEIAEQLTNMLGKLGE